MHTESPHSGPTSTDISSPLLGSQRLYNPQSFVSLAALSLLIPLVTFCAIGGIGAGRPQGEGPPPLAWVVLVVGLIGMYVCEGMLMYRMWAQIQDGSPKLSPRDATLLFLIPLVNLYGFFPSVHGLSRVTNEYVRSRQLRIAPSLTGTAKAACVMRVVALALPLLLLALALLLALIPGLGILGLLAGSVLSYVAMVLLGLAYFVVWQIAWWSIVIQAGRLARLLLQASNAGRLAVAQSALMVEKK